MTIVFFLPIISLLVFVHEWGHFFAARRTGVVVDEFGFGFPPRLWSTRRGSTIWSVNLIPFGGFVRLQGEQEDAANRPGSFIHAPRSKKLLILAAGVMMNYLLAWVLFSLVLTVGVSASRDTLPSDRWYRFVAAGQTMTVGADSPAAKAGLRSGDKLITVNGQRFTTTDELIAYVQQQGWPALTIAFERQGRRETAVVSPTSTATVGPRYGLGVETTGRLYYPWYVTPWYGLGTSLRVAGQTFAGVGRIVVTLVTTGNVSQDITGPIGIAVLTKQVSQLGPVAILQFMAIISVSLAVLNFLPIPALDGGRALFVAIESFRGRPIDRRLEAIIHTASFYALLFVILLISIRDVQRFNLLGRLRQLWS